MLAGADDANAQASAETQAAAAEYSAEAPETAQRLVRRYVPRFIGKRKQDTNDISLEKLLDEIPESDLEDIKDFDESKLIEILDSLGNTEIIDEETDISSENGGDVDDSGEYLEENTEGLDDTQEVERRYIPSFVGKRYNPMFVGKRYNPMFVGRRYSPMFVGKRYIPRFVGKRYIPRFVGKRYRPMFVGKRGRGSPMFVGKRYNPMFVGKRYKPMFVGKKSSVIPRFVGKRYNEDEEKRRVPMFLGKRSVSEESQAKIEENDNSQEDLHSRKKRSLMMDQDSELKRAWGTYVPWQDIPTYKMLQSASPAVEKRFVAPEFIGRRDSLSSLLTALKALRYARNEPRLASKRFQAPLFIGKRDGSSEDSLLKYYRLSPLSDGRHELITALQELSENLEWI